MDSDSEVPAVRPDSAGDHSVRSQLIVVSPRSSESTEQRQDPDIMVVINPSAAAGLSSNGESVSRAGGHEWVYDCGMPAVLI